ncbi:MAG: GNAT family N-acetyltransferase [bacterium]
MSEYRRPEIEEIKKSENKESEFNSEEIEKKQEEIRKQIDDIINNFVNGKKTRESFIKMCEDLGQLRDRNDIEIEDIEKAWTEEQMDKVIDIFEDDELGIVNPDYFFYFRKYLTGKISEENNSDPLNKLLLKLLWERMYKQAEDKEISNFMLDTQRFEFLGDESQNNFDQWNREGFVKRLLPTFERNKKNLEKAMKIIDVAELYAPQDPHDISLTLGGRGYAEEVLAEIYDYDNYFLRFGVENKLKPPLYDISLDEKKKILKKFNYYHGQKTEDEINHDFLALQEDDPNFYHECQIYQTEKLLERYNNDELKKFDIEPLGTSKTHSCYSKLSDKVVAIYGINGEVESAFELERAKTNKEVKRLTLVEILEKEGFGKDNFDKHEYLAMLGNYKTLIELPFRAKIEDEFGISLSDYSVREQLQFVNFLSSRTVEEVEKIKKFLNNAGNPQGKCDRIKSFLSLEMDRDNGNRILEIGDKFETEDANLVFSKIAEFVSWAEREKEELNEELYKSKDYEAMAATQRELLKRAHSDIIEFNKISKDDENGAKELIEKLENRKMETTVLVAFLKSLAEQGKKLNFEEIKNFELETKEHLDEKEQEEILELSDKTWEEQLPTVKDVVIEGVKKAFENDAQEWNLLKHQGKIAGCFRFEKLSDDKLYWGAVLVAKELRGLKIGDGMFEIVKRKAENNTIIATVSSKLPIGCFYVEKLGFNIDGFINDYHKTKEPFFTITLNKKANEKDIQERKKNAENYKEDGLRDLIGKDTIIRRYNLPKDFSRFNAEAEFLLPAKDDNGEFIGHDAQNKYKATKYFQDKSEKEDIRYVLFRKGI